MRSWCSLPLVTLYFTISGHHHPNIVCNHCKEAGITGMRWKCDRCADFDLCTKCYMSDAHSLTHEFIRFNTDSDTGYVWCWSMCKKTLYTHTDGCILLLWSTHTCVLCVLHKSTFVESYEIWDPLWRYWVYYCINPHVDDINAHAQQCY